MMRIERNLVAALLASGALFGAVAPAQAFCRQSLALGLDVSGSVDNREYRLQLDGLANALLNREVQGAFLAMPDAPVRLLVFEWSGMGTQNRLIDWVDVETEKTLEAIAQRLKTTPRKKQELPTALGRAMQFGAAELAKQSDCWRMTLDISGDGESNVGPRPRAVKESAAMQNITINALTIGAEAAAGTGQEPATIGELSAYFKAEVIRGPQAFVETAVGFEAYQETMQRKLLKELETLAVGTLFQ